MFKNELKTQKSQETRALVMKKALAIFLAKGFEKATLRELSKATGMSLGSFYYYFPSKESIVLAFYEENFTHFADVAQGSILASPKFEKRFEAFVKARIDTMEPEREIFLQLARSATDPKSALSPFAPETAHVRDSTIAVVHELLQGSDLKAPKALAPYLPTLLWLAMMGVVLFWTFDESPGRSRTYKLIPMLAKHLGRMLRAMSLPLVGKHILPLTEILTLFPSLKPYQPKTVNIGDPK